MEIFTANTLDELDSAAWDALSAGRPFASYRWFRYGERAMAGRKALHVVVTRAGEAVARGSFWLVGDEPIPVRSPLARRLLGPVLKRHPLLICRSPLSDTSGLILPDPPLRQPALEAILSAAAAFGRREHASFLVCDYLTPEEASLADWSARWSQTALADPGTCMPIRWSSYDAYLGGLSRSVWKDYRRQRNQAERIGLEIRAESQVSAIQEALPLIRGVEDKHGAQPKPWAQAMLEHAGMVPSTWITARAGGQLVGCGLLLEDNGAQLATLLGLAPGTSSVYFQVVYAAIQRAVEQGARMLRMGSGAYEFKQRLGFQLEQNNFLRYSAQNGLLGRLDRLAAG